MNLLSPRQAFAACGSSERHPLRHCCTANFAQGRVGTGKLPWLLCSWMLRTGRNWDALWSFVVVVVVVTNVFNTVWFTGSCFWKSGQNSSTVARASASKSCTLFAPVLLSFVPRTRICRAWSPVRTV